MAKSLPQLMAGTNSVLIALIALVAIILDAFSSATPPDGTKNRKQIPSQAQTSPTELKPHSHLLNC